MVQQLIDARIIGDIEPGAEVGLNLRFSTDPELENADGLNLAIAYNSEIFEVQDLDPDAAGLQIQDPFEFGLQGFSDQPDEDDIDNDPNTDRVTNGAFADPAIFGGEDGAWPWEEVPEGQTSVNLGTVQLVVDENFDPDVAEDDFINVTLREAQRGFDENQRGQVLDGLNVRNLDPDDQNQAPEIVAPDPDDVITITEDFEVGDTVFTVEATDPEEDEITFSFADDTITEFAIDEQSGEVTLEEELEAGQFALDVIATDEFGAESDPVTFDLEVAEGAGVIELLDEENDIFRVNGSDEDPAELRHTLEGRLGDQLVEVGLVLLEEGETTEEALADGANFRTVFSVLPEQFANGEPGNFDETTGQLSRILSANSERVGYILNEGNERTIDEIVSDGNFGDLELGGFDTEELGDGSFTLSSGDLSFTIEAAEEEDIPVGSRGAQTQEDLEVFDLSDANQTVTANLSFDVISEADFDNAVGFYAVDDASGTVNGVAPGQEGYLDEVLGAALQDTNTGEDIILQRDTTADFSVEVSGGQIIVPFLLPDVGNIDEIPDEAGGGGGVFLSGQGGAGGLFTPYAAANPDGADHFRLLGDNIFGVEDLLADDPNFDGDFNDFVFGANFTPNPNGGNGGNGNNGDDGALV